MKPIISLLIFTATIFATNVWAVIPPMDEETGVNDIPFNTELIAGTTSDHGQFVKMWEMEAEPNVGDFPYRAVFMIAMDPWINPWVLMEDEQYVNDVPFNTRKIFSDCCVKFMCEKMEEGYVDDIPFSTSVIYSNWKLERQMELMADENNSDDVPFNTEELANEALFEHIVMDSYAEEVNVSDLPFNTSQVFSAEAVDEAFAGYYDEKNVPGLPFDTREVFCENLRSREGRKVRFSNDISSVTCSLPQTMSMKMEKGLDYIEYMDVLMENIEESWLEGKGLTNGDKILFNNSRLTIDL